MAKQAGVPFLFISAPAFQSMWQGMTAYRIRSFFKNLRKIARKEGGAIGFIEEIDAIGMSRGGQRQRQRIADDAGPDRLQLRHGRHGVHGERAADPDAVLRPAAHAHPSARQVDRLHQRLPPNDRQLTPIKSEYHNILLIAATNRGDSLDPALVRPGRFDRRLYFDVPTKQGRAELIDFFLNRKRHHQQLDDEQTRERIAYETFGYTPVMIEHLFDESLLGGPA